MSDRDNSGQTRRTFFAGAASAAAAATPQRAAAQTQANSASTNDLGGQQPERGKQEPYQPIPRAKSLQVSDDRKTLTRSKNEAELWDQINSSLDHEYNRLTVDGTISGVFSPYCLRIESTKCGALESNLEETQFNHLRVEHLLNEAAELLNRGIADRSQYDDLAAKYIDILLEIHEFRDLDHIHLKEEAEGRYDVAPEETERAYSAEERRSQTLRTEEQSMRRIIDQHFTSKHFREKMNATRQAAWAGTVKGYDHPKPEKRSVAIPYPWAGVSGNSAPEHPTAHAQNAANLLAAHAVGVEHSSREVERLSTQGSSESAATVAQGLHARARWESKNREFKLERIQTARTYETIKARAVLEDDGALNYGKRLEALRNRFCGDFLSAQTRIRAARRGLLEVFEIDHTLPEELQGEHQVTADDLNYFDACLDWTREAIDILAGLSHREQGVVFPVSIRDRASGGWDAGAALKKEWTIELSAADFPEMRAVRLRGISAVSRGSAGVEWQLGVKAPNSTLPTVRLTRVCGSSEWPRDLDIAGQMQLFNVSPIGEWRVMLEGATPSVTSISGLVDFTLYLHVVGIANGGSSDA